MSKTIKVDDEVYEDLYEIQVKGETFSHVVERLLRLYKAIEKAAEILGPGHYLKQRPVVDARAKETINR